MIAPRHLAIALWGAIAFALLPLARGLPPETFVVGDPGVKLILARNAIARPAQPLDVPLPAIGGVAAPYVEPFFAVHGDHAHAVTSELFPLLTAPWLAWFGSRGAYLLPGIGFLASLAAWAWLATVLDRRRHPALTVTIGALATPLFFYGLEFWEHAPAVAAGSAATALFASAGQRGTSARAAVGFGAGLLFGIAVLLRPEAAWYAAAVLIASPLLPVAPGFASVAATIAGIGAALAPLVVYTTSHFGTPLNPHVGNITLFGADWIGTRGALIWTWFVAPSTVNAWRVAPALLLALWPYRGTPALGGRGFLMTVTLITTALVVVTAPNDGGGQWGPRYLLLAYGPLVVLAADTLQAMPRRAWAMALMATVVIGSAWTQRTAYRELRVAKQIYGRMLEFVRHEVPAGAYVITDLWWLDQVTAAAAMERRFLYAPDTATDALVLQRLSLARIDLVTVIRSREESGQERMHVEDPCWVEEGRREIPERALVAIQLRRVCSS